MANGDEGYFELLKHVAYNFVGIIKKIVKRSFIKRNNKNNKNNKAINVLDSHINELIKKLQISKKNKGTKFNIGNCVMKIKTHALRSVFEFINTRIKHVYKDEIKAIEENQNLHVGTNGLNKTIGNIFSNNISGRYRSRYEKDFNKKLIERLMLGDDQIIKDLLNLSFFECIKHFSGRENKLLKGMDMIYNYKKKMAINDEDYFKHLKDVADYFVAVNEGKVKDKAEDNDSNQCVNNLDLGIDNHDEIQDDSMSSLSKVFNDIQGYNNFNFDYNIIS